MMVSAIFHKKSDAEGFSGRFSTYLYFHFMPQVECVFNDDTEKCGRVYMVSEDIQDTLKNKNNPKGYTFRVAITLMSYRGFFGFFGI